LAHFRTQLPAVQITHHFADCSREKVNHIEKQIITVLEEKVNPVLADHFGGAELTGYEDGVVYVKLTGACGSCPSAQYTVEDVVKAEIMGALPEVTDVVLDLSVSEDLIGMARKILQGKS
jgi:Fe-S cluster biogenesis protein NfuA